MILAALAIILSGASPLRDEPNLDGPFHIETKASKRLEVTFTESITGPLLQADKWMVTTASPPTFEGQHVTSAAIYIPGNRNLTATKKTDKLGQAYLTCEYPVTEAVDKATTRAQLIVGVTLNERTLTEGKVQEVPAPLSGKAALLAPTELINLGEDSFHRWLAQVGMNRVYGERDLKYAWRAFEFISKYMEHKETVSDVRVTATVEANGSTAEGIAYLYVAMLRANDIPARAVIRRDLDPFKDAKEPYGQYVFNEAIADATVEFWADGIGWVPTDPFMGMGDYEPFRFFGKDPGDTLAMHFDNVVIPEDQVVNLDRFRWSVTEGVMQFSGATITRKLEIENKTLDKKGGGSSAPRRR